MRDHVIIVNVTMQVRRTRISERIRKLQDLVPNMEKVTNLQGRDRSIDRSNSATSLSFLSPLLLLRRMECCV
jgi:hypothetical protein